MKKPPMRKRASTAQTAEPSSLTRRGLLSSAGLLAAATFAGCKEREFSCWDAGDLPEADLKARRAVEYLDRAADASRRCDLCQHWQPSGPGTCGGCAVVRGPIHPLGTCRVFTKRA